MIQANELRIGNFVFRNDLPGGMFYEIRALCKDRVHPINVIEQDVKKNVYYASDCTLSELEPIPLTPEILEKCGFTTVTTNEDRSYNFWGKDLDASIDVDSDNLFRYRICERKRTKTILYVHQLQNLYFSLTGTELEVNL